MKLRVEEESGEIETIEITGSCTLHIGQELDRLVDSGSGIEHFFTKDGYYDGWGRFAGACPTTTDRIH